MYFIYNIFIFSNINYFLYKNKIKIVYSNFIENINMKGHIFEEIIIEYF